MLRQRAHVATRGKFRFTGRLASTRPAVAVIAIAACLPGCRSPRPTGPLAEWQFLADRRFAYSANDPDGLSQVKGLLVTGRGEIWALEASTHDIRVFDSTGRPVRRIGQKGRGPGEFLWPDGMALGPDGVIWVHDPQNGRFSLFAEDGRFVRQQVAPALGYAWVWTGGVDRDGRVWDLLFGLGENGEGERLRRAFPDWSRADTIELPQCQPSGRSQADGYFRGASYTAEVPFYPAPVRAFDWAAGAMWCAPSGGAYQLFKLDLERRDTVARIRAKVSTLPVSPTERDSAIAELRKFLARQGEPDADWSRIPSVKPAVAGALVDGDGRLWVRRSGVGSGSQFDIYSAEGVPIATLRLPFPVSSWVAPAVRGDRAWLVALDQDGLPRIVRGRLEP